MNSLIFLNTFEFFQNFLYDFKNTVVKQNFKAIIVKLLVHDMESCYRNIHIKNSQLFMHFPKFSRTLKQMQNFFMRNQQIHFIQKIIGYLIIYGIIFY